MQQKKYRIRKDDKVMVIAGKEKGKVGKVLQINKKTDRVLIEKVNMVKRHQRGNPYMQQAGGIVEKEAPIALSNVQVICNACAEPSRMGYKRTEDGKKLRFCKKCNEVMD